MKKEKLAAEAVCRRRVARAENAADRHSDKHGAAAKRLSGFPGDGAAGGRAGDGRGEYLGGENTEGSAGNPDDTMGLVPDEYAGREA